MAHDEHFASMPLRRLRFRDDGTFRVLQLADVQDGPDVSPDALELIDAAIEESDPDLVVLTGDQIRGYDPAFVETFTARHGEHPGSGIPLGVRAEMALDGRSDAWMRFDRRGQGDGSAALRRTKSKVMASFVQFLEPIVSRGIPFAATYGNHDFQCGIGVDEQDAMYRRFPGCLNPPAADGDNGGDGASQDGQAIVCEPGTFALPVLSNDGQDIALGIVLVNSGDYDAGGYGAPSDTAVQWLPEAQKQLRGMRQSLGGRDAAVPSIAFQHIPPQQIYRCLRRASAFTPHAVEGSGPFAGSYFVPDPDVCRPGTALGEGPCCSARDTGEFAALRDTDGYFALYSGHDHKNTIIGSVDGIDLGYSPTCGFSSYGPKPEDHALRLFVFKQDDPRGYDTTLLTYADLVHHPVRARIRACAAQVLPASTASVGDALRRSATGLRCFAAAGCAVLIGIAGAGIVHRRRRGGV